MSIWLLLGFYVSTQVAEQAQGIPDEWEYAGVIAAVIAASGTLAGVGYFIWKKITDWRIWCDPLMVHYLIPPAGLSARPFPGAPADEQWPDRLTIGLGEHIVMLRVVVKAEMLIDSFQWSFPDASDAVMDLGSENPYVVETKTRPDGRVHILSWHGIWDNAEGPGPVIYAPGRVRVTGHRILTKRPWTGTLQVALAIRGRGVVVKALPFQVVDGPGDIPFLKCTDSMLSTPDMEGPLSR